ncbi:unnamed protein product [Allacma fusca]|uniref:Uncharacterized protein n=1 Tax=Allacma fusca TaxID=39272 RepID=A0A8J2Q508_9HEXA|nr:unnamed protein product [Allacma fusca]
MWTAERLKFWEPTRHQKSKRKMSEPEDILKWKPKKEIKRRTKIEKINFSEQVKVKVTTVATYTDLKTMINSVKEVTQVGCYLAGVTGRFGSCPFIILNIGESLYTVDVGKLELVPDLRLWEIMGSRIFGDRRILKVCFECKAMIDYLYHRQGVVVANVMDLREVARKYLEKLLRFNKHPPLDGVNRIEKAVSSLYQVCRIFLPGKIPDLELKVLLEFMIAPELRLEGFCKLQNVFYVLQVKYLALLKSDLEIREGKFLENLFKKRFKSVMAATDDKALEFFRRVHLQGVTCE